MDGEGLRLGNQRSVSTLHCIQCLELQSGFLRHVKFPSLGPTTAAITEERLAVMLVFRAETPLVCQVCRKLLVEGLTNVLGHYRQEFEGTAGILVCGCKLMKHDTHCPLPPVATNKFLWSGWKSMMKSPLIRC